MDSYDRYINRAAYIAMVLLACATLAPCARALEEEPGLTLGDALRTALSHNRTLNAARQQSVMAQAGLTQARAGMLPRFDIDETFTETNNPTLVFSNLLNQQRFTQNDFALDKLNHPSSLSNFDTRIRVEQPLFTGGKLLAGLDAAHEGIAAAGGQEARAEQETVYQTRRAYYGVLLADGNLTAVDRALAAAREHAESAQALFDRGVAVRSDLLRAEVLVGSLERQRIDATSATRTARSQLSYAMGAGRDIRLQDTDAWPALDAPPSLVQSTDTALRQRPDLQALEHEWQRNEAMLRQVQAEYLPSLGVIGQYDINSQDLNRAGDSYAVFVGARWNVFNGLATSGKAQEAAAQAARSRLLRDDLADRVRVEVEQAWHGLTGATQQVDVAQHNQEQAQEHLSIVRDRYSGGLARTVDVMDAVATREQAELELLQSRVARQVRHAELELATGQPVPSAE